MLFRPELVEKIKTGRKTQTRRPLPCSVRAGETLFVKEATWLWGYWIRDGVRPSGRPSYMFVVQDTIAMPTRYAENPPAKPLRAIKRDGLDKGSPGYAKRSPLHCRAKDARLFLKVIDVFNEALQDISEASAVQEGVEVSTGIGKDGLPSLTFRNYATGNMEVWTDGFGPYESFQTLWDSINGTVPSKCWGANPQVAAIVFEPTDNPLVK